MEFERKTADGRYGIVTTPAGDHELWRIATPAEAAQFAADLAADPDLARLIGTNPDIHVGNVFDPDNIETAAIAADEEMAALEADAREEFGF